MKRSNSASTVDKAIRVLLALADEGGEIGTIDLGQKLGIHKATVSRLLVKLAEYELVYKNRVSGKYWLGPTIHQLAMKMSDTNFKQVIEIAHPFVDELRDSVKETVTLEMWLGNSTVPTYSAMSRQLLTVAPPPGEPLALHAAAGAKAILSFLHVEQASRLLEGELKQLTPKTITDKNVLNDALIEYNKQGYATDREELHEGICAIAAPIFDNLHQPFAALVILIPASRSSQMMNQEMITKLKNKASLISRQVILEKSKLRTRKSR